MSGFLNFISKVKGFTRGRADPSLVLNKTRDTQSSSEALIYPSDLFTAAQESYILFFRRDGVARAGKIKTRMALYMPPAIRVNYGTQWEELQMKVFQYMDVGKEIYNAGESIITNPKEFLSSSAAKQLGLTGARAAGNFLEFVASGSNIGQQLEVFTRKTVNPHDAMSFKGVDYRTFEFTFQLMARNRKESDEIQKIIKEFKLGMHPNADTKSLGRFWEYPDCYDIHLYSGTGAIDAETGKPTQYMFQIATCALVSMNVDYAGSSIPSFFYDNGAPVDIRLTLQFKELEILTREKIEEGY